MRTVVEGISTNIDILCNLDRRTDALYWKINHLIYDLYSVPKIFTILEHEALSLAEVDRRMNGWRFQCFTINPNIEGGLNLGRITVLVVVYGKYNYIASDDLFKLEAAFFYALLDIDHDLPASSGSLLSPSTTGRLLLYYQQLQIGPVNTSLGWLYSNDNTSESVCVPDKYRIDVYRKVDIANTEDENSLRSIVHFETTEEIITLPSQFLNDSTHYFRISALLANDSYCTRSVYFHSLTFG